jgi:hypothetical protein
MADAQGAYGLLRLKSKEACAARRPVVDARTSDGANVGTDLFKVRWTQPAEADLDKIIDAIAKDAPPRAVDFGRRLQELAGSLCWSPHCCHFTGTEL